MVNDINDNDLDLIENPVNLDYSKPSRSRFLFLLGLFGFVLFFVGCNYGLWTRSFKSTQKIAVPESTKSSPKYK